MSIRAMQWAFEQEVKPSSRKFLLVTMANFADEDGHCWPSQEILAKYTGQSVKTVERGLADLENDIKIRRTERRLKNGRKTSDGIQLIFGETKNSEQKKTTIQGDDDNPTNCLVDAPATRQSVRLHPTVCPTSPVKLSGIYKDEPSVNPQRKERARAAPKPPPEWWSETKSGLARELGKTRCQSWIDPLVPEAIDDNLITLRARSPFERDYLNKHLRPVIERLSGRKLELTLEAHNGQHG